MTSRQVVVVPYDPTWPARFEAEAARLRKVFGPLVCAVHHIGSTSVVGLPAKPIIDILLEVRDIQAVDACDAAMVALGYEPKGEYGIPGRRYFRKGQTRRTHHVHAFQHDNRVEIERHLAFRDYLRAHAAEAHRYAQLKQELARRHPRDIEAYMDGKDALVKELERRALEWYGA